MRFLQCGVRTGAPAAKNRFGRNALVCHDFFARAFAAAT
jgi:hypothetical protein